MKLHSHRPAAPLRGTALAALALCLGAAQTPATAQAVAPAEGQAPEASTKLDTVVVTARKRAELSQSVPIAISAFSADAIERKKIVDAADLQFSVPGAVLANGDTFQIRGIGYGAVGGEGGVQVTLNGTGIGVLPQDELFDLERIEVLRGPQGTLFGRNSTGGAIAVVTKQPTYGFSGNVRAEVGDYAHQRLGGVLNFSVGESVRQRFAGYQLKRDGFNRNLTTGGTVEGRNQYSVRSTTAVDLGEHVQANLVLSRFDEDGTRDRGYKRLCKRDEVLGCSPNSLSTDSPAFFPTLFGALSGVPAALGLLPAKTDIYAGAQNPPGLRDLALDITPHQSVTADSQTLNITVDLGGHTLSYVGGHSEFTQRIHRDWDGAALTVKFARPITYSISETETVTTDAIIAGSNFSLDTRSTTHELRLVSSASGPFSYATGLFMLDGVRSFKNQLFHPYFELYQQLLKLDPRLRFYDARGQGDFTKASAWFGEGQYRISPDLRTTLGARYTRERRGGAGVLNFGVSSKTVNEFSAREEINESKWTYRGAVDWAPMKDSLVYGSIATGFKGGGINAISTDPKEKFFKGETVTAYELGYKGEFLDRSLRTNVAVFYNDYKDMQLGKLVNAGTLNYNADATTKGAELELAYAANASWLFDATVSLLRTAVGKAGSVDNANPAQDVTKTTPQVQVNLQGKELPYSPHQKVTLGVQYKFALLGWPITARLDHAWQGGMWVREFNAGADRIGSWGMTNLQLRTTSPGGAVEVKAWVKNLADKENLTGAYLESELIGRYRTGRVMDPRHFGVEVQYNF